MLRALFLIIGLLPAIAAAADTPLRITALQRCGDLLQAPALYCLRASGLQEGKVVALERDGDGLRLRLGERRRSGPLWLRQGGRDSNAVWLTSRRSHVVAARPNEVARNMDGLITYVDLVSLLIEEKHDGLTEARRIAARYGAEVVGAIPPLNVYQLRLPVNNLTERDAMILRMGSEVSVDAVIVEESAPEREGEAAQSPPRPERAANRFVDAIDFYRRWISAKGAEVPVAPVRIGIIEREVDFDAPDFADYVGACEGRRTCLFARDAERPDDHGSTVAGILAAAWDDGGNSGFLRALDRVGPGFEVIVERNADAGITANIAASVNLVEDGARVLNWSWGIHRVGTRDAAGDEIDSLVRSGLAMSGYEELLEEFFLWLRDRHPDVVVINSAGNGAAFSGQDEYRLPSSFITEQLLVVGGHQRSGEPELKVEDPGYAVKRRSSNVDMRVDITAAACTRASVAQPGQRGERHCGTSYATPLVTATIAAMLSVNPELTPEQLRMLLRRSALTIGDRSHDFEPMDAEDLTAPILPSERRQQLDDADVGRSARLDMQKAIELAVQSRERVR